jgi:hypothetical protein
MRHMALVLHVLPLKTPFSFNLSSKQLSKCSSVTHILVVVKLTVIRIVTY